MARWYLKYHDWTQHYILYQCLGTSARSETSANTALGFIHDLSFSSPEPPFLFDHMVGETAEPLSCLALRREWRPLDFKSTELTTRPSCLLLIVTRFSISFLWRVSWCFALHVSDITVPVSFEYPGLAETGTCWLQVNLHLKLKQVLVARV